MICKNCGNAIRDDAKFCPHCGALGGAAPVYAGPEAPVPGPGRGKKGLIIGGVVAAVVVVAALAAVFAGGLFANPRGQVEQAMAKSLAAYQAAEEALGMPDISRWQRDQTISQGMRLELTGLNSDLVGYDLSALEGLGLEMSTSYSGKDRQMFARLAAFWGEDDLLTFQMVADGPELYVDVPQITGESSYGVNTETLGADLYQTTGDSSVKDISFNIFDMADKILERLDQEALEQAIQSANRTLWEAAQVEKAGSDTISVNGSDTKVKVYQVTLSKDALSQYVDDWMEILSAINYFSLYRELLQDAGLPQEQIDTIMGELDEMEVYGQLANSLKEAIARFGDVKLEVCVGGGYVSAVCWEGEIQGETVEALLTLGGGEEYVDDWSLELSGSGKEKIELKSTGDHGLKGGVYTDETTLRIREGGSTLLKATSHLSLNPRLDKDNFQWELEVNSSGLAVFSLETEGDFSMGDDYLSLHLDDVSLRAVGMEICSLAFEYRVSNVPDRLAINRPRLIPQMDETELMQMVLDTQERALRWSSEMESLFLSRLPEELIWALMYA